MKKINLRIVGAAATMVSVVALSACSPEIKVVPEQSTVMSGTTNQSGTQSGQQSADSGTLNLDTARITRIVEGVQEVIDRASLENNPETLTERLSGGALALRQGQFEQAKLTGTDLDSLQINVNVASATAADSWPRVLLVGSSAATDDPAEVFIFTQESAQSDYMLENWVRAVGGNSVRGVAVDGGTTVLPLDATGFKMTPTEALQTYLNFLNDPANPEYQLVSDNTFGPRYISDLQALNDAVAKAGTVTAHAEMADYPLTTVSLVNGDALVSASFTYTHVYDRTIAKSTMSVGGTAAAFLADPNVIGTVTVTYLVNTVFMLPPSGSTELIRFVGSERTLLSVTKDDAAIPEGE